MDIHRCRFVPYEPGSINALAFTHSSSQNRTPSELRLAVGRDNGNIEIWSSVDGKWFQERIFRGGNGRTIEQLVWTQDLIVDTESEKRPIENGSLRLFSSGASTSITEWDVGAGVPKVHTEGNSGAIWCFAAQPQWPATGKRANLTQAAAAPSQLLVAGCTNGTILLFSTADNSLQYIRTLFRAPGKKSRVLSITWKDRDTVVAGFENSTIRVLDLPSRTVVRTMSLGLAANRRNAAVWTVKCLPDGTIVSGDSTGELKIWDSVTCSLIQRLKSHDEDVLDVATNRSGDVIVTTGSERRTVVFRKGALQEGEKERWYEAMPRRFHQHNVNALAAFESREISIIVSGGLDTAPIIMPLQNFDKEYHRTLPHLPQRPQMSASSKTRLMLTWWRRDLLLWQLPERDLSDGQNGPGEMNFPSHSPVATIQLSDDNYISSAQISEDGSLVVAATSMGVKLFQIRKRNVDGIVEVRTRPVTTPAGIASFGASLVGFSPDSKWLYAVRTSNVVVLAKVITDTSSKGRFSMHEGIVKLERKNRKVALGKLDSYRKSINCVTFSADSRILCTGDLLGAVDAWILEGHESIDDIPATRAKNTSAKSANSSTGSDSSDSGSDSDSDSDDDDDVMIIHGQKWIRNPLGSDLPLLDSGILALAFKPLPAPLQISKGATLGLHATRHNPHPVGHEYPSPTTLVAVTASHSIIEFDVLSAKLSEWSRRNPPSTLPSKFLRTMDRTMGMFWDCQPAHQRLYIYGPNFIFMLDLAHDVGWHDAPESLEKIGRYDVHQPSSSMTELEKRSAAKVGRSLQYSGPSARKKQKTENGSRHKIAHGQWQAPELVRHHQDTHPAANEFEQVDIDSSSSDDDLHKDDEDPNLAVSVLASFRRRPRDNAAESNSTLSRTTRGSSNSQFITHRYRSILGVVAISSGRNASSTASATQGDDADGPNDLEIVVVERPLYDVNTVPRRKHQEW